MNAPHYTKDMQDVADICGEAVALELMLALPGLEVRIPHALPETGILLRLRPETLKKIVETFPGDVFYIPSRPQVRDTRAEAQRLQDAGKNVQEIALELGITQRHVRGLLNTPLIAPDPRQMRLFDD